MRVDDIVAINEALYILEDDQRSQDLVDPVAETNLNWDDLRKLIQLAAERLWRDHFVQYRTAQEARHDWRSRKPTEDERGRRFHLTILTRQAHALMLLWLERSLYHLRAVKNSQAREGVPTDRPQIRSDIQAEVNSYLRTLEVWDNELHTITGQWYFRKQFGDGQRLRVLSPEFGPSKVDAHEKGWAPIAPDAHSALRYAYFEILRKESLHAYKPLAALGYSTLWITTGYGTRPMRFAMTALSTIGLIALLFFLNDFFYPGIANTGAHFCPGVNVHISRWTDILTTFVHYVYVATANLTSLSSDSQLAPYCRGTSTQIILTFSAIAGYFLLAILASLFIQLLTEKD